MSDFYTEAQRALQDEFDSRALADRLAEAIVTETFSDDQAEFIHGRNMFFLSTIDEHGFPSSSYKGGAPGFVRVVNDRTLAFPSYDGNGMFMSLGNIESQQRVGLLFIDFEIPRRMRVRGEARLLREGPILAGYPGAELAVEVSVDRIWQNCPRYVHRMQPMETSAYVPAEDGTTRLALWKRIDVMQDVINSADRAEAEAAGLIDVDTYEALVENGEL